jgi:ribosomal protein L7Ae-like RNA K-turn-binding protein
VKNFAQNLGLCRKAGALAIGYNEALEAMKRNKAIGILTACDISAKTLKEVKFYAEKYKTEVINLPFGREEIGNAIGISAAVIAVTNESLYKLFK